MVTTIAITDAARDAVPGLHVAWRSFERTGPPAEHPPPLQLDARLHVEGLKDQPTARAYRDLSWALGIDPTKRRPAGEALARRVLGGSELPRIHPFVDAYNRASARTLVPLSAYDTDAIVGRLALDVARDGEAFHGIAKEPEELTGKELVLRDDEGVTSVFLYRDSDRTKLTPESVGAVVVACGAPKVQTATLRDALALAEVEARDAGWAAVGPFVAST